MDRYVTIFIKGICSMDTIKRSCLLLMILLSSVEYSFGQEADAGKNYFHNISIGNGLFTIHRTDLSTKYPSGLICTIGYGGEVTLNVNWSVMNGIRYRLLIGGIFEKPTIGGDNQDLFKLADYSFQLRYRVDYGNVLLVFAMGPMLSLDFSPQYNDYWVDPPVSGPSLLGKRKYKTWDILYTPNISLVLWKYWIVGLEIGLGLNNIMVQYPEFNKTGNMHHFYALLTTGARF